MSNGKKEETWLDDGGEEFEKWWSFHAETNVERSKCPPPNLDGSGVPNVYVMKVWTPINLT